MSFLHLPGGMSFTPQLSTCLTISISTSRHVSCGMCMTQVGPEMRNVRSCSMRTRDKFSLSYSARILQIQPLLLDHCTPYTLFMCLLPTVYCLPPPVIHISPRLLVQPMQWNVLVVCDDQSVWMKEFRFLFNDSYG